MGVWYDDDTFKTPEWRGDGLDRGYRSVDYPNFFFFDSSSHISNSPSHNTVVIEHAALCIALTYVVSAITVLEYYKTMFIIYTIKLTCALLNW